MGTRTAARRESAPGGGTRGRRSPVSTSTGEKLSYTSRHEPRGCATASLSRAARSSGEDLFPTPRPFLPQSSTHLIIIHRRAGPRPRSALFLRTMTAFRRLHFAVVSAVVGPSSRERRLCAVRLRGEHIE